MFRDIKEKVWLLRHSHLVGILTYLSKHQHEAMFIFSPMDGIPLGSNLQPKHDP